MDIPMAREGLTHYRTGVLVPVAALRSEANLGAGEFADLPALAKWCADLGLDTIQLLPVNDSGGESSPYSALSAFALHPFYLRISDLPEVASLPAATRKSVTEELDRIRDRHQGADRIRYRDILRDKLAVIRTVFEASTMSADITSAMDDFVRQNPWIRPYAVFKHLKRINEERSWTEWTDFRDPDQSDIDAAWQDDQFATDIGFDVWMQWRLHEQFSAAAAEVNELGVILKGDLPILMNDDSVDVWFHRDKFVLDLRAGAPPDMFSHLGQNWGLPIYDWDAMAGDGFAWWKARLKHASKFYSAYRIDHVLGFFRVWAIPAENTSGLLGWFVPSCLASRERLQRIGFDDGRVRWLSEPHLTGEELRAAFGVHTADVISAALTRIADEDLYLFLPRISGERAIHSLDLPEPTRDWLASRYGDRALIRVSDDEFAPAWNFRSCSRYQQLAESEKSGFEELVHELSTRSEQIWEQQATRLLGFMSETTPMLPCAEDLGVIPSVVPTVLSSLGILGLRIPRWSRIWDKPDQPFVRPERYPVLTVCAPSVHDTSTLRGWWEEGDGLEGFWQSLNLAGEPPKRYTAETAREVIGAILRTTSSICVLQIQDILALTPVITPQPPDQERVNVPGTVNEFNWNYRLPVSLDELAGIADLKDVLSPLVRERRSRPVQEVHSE